LSEEQPLGEQIDRAGPEAGGGRAKKKVRSQDGKDRKEVSDQGREKNPRELNEYGEGGTAKGHYTERGEKKKS